jgi:hypothetical protein
MSRLTNKSPLTVIRSASTVPPPPRKVGEHGMALWNSVQREYGITDIGGIELLCLAAQSLDRAESLSARIAEDGETIRTRGGIKSHPALRDELAARAFIARTLVKLGICTENVKATGRPGSAVGWVPEA